jgi:hypothetical protein
MLYQDSEQLENVGCRLQRLVGGLSLEVNLLTLGVEVWLGTIRLTPGR